MATISRNGGTVADRVPAWKKIGLKLKNASDNAARAAESMPQASTQPEADQANTASQDSVSKKSAGHNTVSIACKESFKSDQAPHANSGDLKKSKRKRSSEVGVDLEVKDDSSSTVLGDELQEVSPSQESHNGVTKDATRSLKKKKDKSEDRPAKRRKSVSFSADTKTEDGESATTLTEEQDSQLITTAKKADEDSKTVNEASKIANPPQGKSRELTKTAYLDYITQFHNDKANWKFNKTKQTDLLKNIFNIYRTPVEYNAALLSYIEGLQGQGVKQRLVDQAKQLIEELKKTTTTELPNDTDMTTPEERKKAYKLAEQREIERMRRLNQLTPQAETDVRETARRRRVQDDRASEILLLRSLAAELGHSLDTPVATKDNSDASLSARQKKRKRKSRTTTSDSDSSSSDSDSDSDAAVAKKAKEKTQGKDKAKKTKTSNDSSSSDSSSSEESSSDDSSDTSSESESESESDSSSSDDSSESESDSGSDASSSDHDDDDEEVKSTTKTKSGKGTKSKKTKDDDPFDKKFLDRTFGEKKSWQKKTK